ncbi:MAG: universal stress protein [Bacteroidota bacterium]
MIAELVDIVLVPTDFSESSQHAVDYGVSLAEDLDYKLFLLHVIHGDGVSQHHQMPLDIPSIIDHLNDLANDIREKSRITVETLAVEGSEHDRIQEVASDIGAKIAVLNSNQKKALNARAASEEKRLFDDHEIAVIHLSPAMKDKNSLSDEK